jgi:hypothetical protein
VTLSWIRRLAGTAALAAALGVAADSTAKAPPPAAAAEEAIKADSEHLKSLFELAKTKKKLEGRIKATAMLIAQYSQDNLSGKDADKFAATRAKALEVAEAITKKNVPAAQAATAQLASVAPDSKADKKPMKLATMNKLELHEVMDLFGGSTGGGMNIEKDIRDAKKNGPKDAAAAALIGTRTAAIANFTADLSPMFGGKKTKTDWDKWTTDMKKQATEIADEASKPKADLAKLKKMFNTLDATCTNCHNVFRDE